MSREYEAPKPGHTKTINVNDWLANSQSGGQVVRPGSRDNVYASQEELKNHWQEVMLERERGPKLEAGTKECSECNKTERYYKDDYMCYKCRDNLEGAE